MTTRLTLHAIPQCPCLRCIHDRDGRPAELLVAGAQVVLGYDYSQALGQLAQAVRVWRDARCMTPGPSMVRPRVDVCDGDNHLESCAVELARQDLLAVHNKLGH